MMENKKEHTEAEQDAAVEALADEVLGGTEADMEVESLIDEVLDEVEKAPVKKTRPVVVILDWVRRGVMLIALGVYMYSVYTLTGIFLDYNQGSSVYTDVNALFQTATDTDQEENGGGILNWDMGKQTDLKWVWNYDTLLEVNEDSVGWIALEGTKIHYPIVQGDDNEYYLHHTIDRAYNFAGTVFVDYRYPQGLDSNYSIIYGHYLKNGTMFAYLNPFQYSDYGNEHNVFDIYIKEKHYRYYVFSVYITKGEETEDSPYQFDLNPVEPEFTESQTEIYEMSEAERKAYRSSLDQTEQEAFDKDYKVVKQYIDDEKNRVEKFETLIRTIRNKSRYVLQDNEYIEEITPEDHILTISTCWSVSENTRMIIHMVRGEEVGDSASEKTQAGED